MDSPKPALTNEPLPPKRKPSIFIWVLKILGVLVAGILLAKIALIFQSPLAHQFFKMMSDQNRLVKEESTAPGTTELRKSGPCTTVTVASPEVRRQMRALGNTHRRGKELPPNQTLITCMAPLIATSPTCGGLARAYVDAVHPTNPFRVAVMPPLRGKGCLADYDSTGTEIDLDAGL